jgi:hypothetical protein
MQTHFHSTSKGHSSSLLQNGQTNDRVVEEWNADYNGDKGHIDMKWDQNGKRKHINLEFTSKELKDLLNVPTVKKPLHLRLVEDFIGTKNQKLHNRTRTRLRGRGREIGTGMGMGKRRGTKKQYSVKTKRKN